VWALSSDAAAHGCWHNQRVAKPRNVAREIVVSLVAAVVFGGALYTYIASSIPVPTGNGLVTPPSAAAAPDDLQLATAVAGRFISALAAGQHADAYALMANTYRERFSLREFSERCAASEYLARSERISLSRTRRVVPAGTSPEHATLQAIGALLSPLGNIDATLTLIDESPGGLKILVLALAGSPILDGVSATR
jgi:hypothetical protein